MALVNDNVNVPDTNASGIHPVPVEYRTRYATSEDKDENVQFLFHLIAPAVFHSHELASNKAYFRSIAGKEYEFPDHTKHSFSVSTLERYLRQYKATGNMDGLYRKERADKGIFKSLTSVAEQAIAKIITEVPTATVPSVLQRLLDTHVIKKGDCSMDSIRRFIIANDLRVIPPDAVKLRKTFLVPHAGDLFVADTVYYEKLGTPVAGKKTPWLYVQGIIDDYSRLMMVAETYTADNALNFQFTLRKAVSLYGIPERLYVDLGSPYNNHDLTLICNRLGIDLIHAPPNDGAAKGVCENKWKQLLNDTRVDIVLDHLTTHEQLDARVQKWRQDYNKRLNSGVGGIPIERFNASVQEKPIRRIPSLQELSEAFSHERHRVLDNLGLIHLDNVKYRAPDELRVLFTRRVTVKVVYDPMDLGGTIHVDYNGKKYPLKVDDPIENGRENARKALECAREAKSCTGMTTEEIRAENRYRARMAGTNRVPAEESGDADAESDTESDEESDAESDADTDTVPVMPDVEEPRADAPILPPLDADQSTAVLADEEVSPAIPFAYS